MTHHLSDRPIIPTTALAVLAVLAAGPAAAAEHWLHVRVNEDGEEISVDVPLSLAESVMSMSGDEQVRYGVLDLDDDGMDAFDLRELLAAVRDSPDATFVTVRDRGELVRVAKEDGYLVATVEGRDRDAERAWVRVPLEVVEAVLTDGDRLDLAAGLRRLADHGGGELVRVDSPEGSIRVWIDRDQDGEQGSTGGGRRSIFGR